MALYPGMVGLGFGLFVFAVGKVDKEFGLEKFFFENLAQFKLLPAWTEHGEGFDLGLDVATAEVKDAIGEGMPALAMYKMLNPRDKVCKGCDGPADDKVELVAQVFNPLDTRLDVFQTGCLCHLLYDFNFLFAGIDEHKICVGEKDGEWYAGESASCTGIEDAGAGLEPNRFSDGKTVEEVSLGEVLDVLAADDVDGLVPGDVGFKSGFVLTHFLLRNLSGKVLFQQMLKGCKFWHHP